MRKPIALVLCGGASSRMGSFADARHKCLVRVDDGRTLFERHVVALAERGFRVHANVPVAWEGAFKAVARAAKVPVRFIVEHGPPHGSGTTLLRLASHERADAYAVVYGDVWLASFLYELLRDCARERDSAIMCGPPPMGEPSAPGIIAVGGYDCVTSIHEAPLAQTEWPCPALQNIGALVVTAGDLRRHGRARNGLDLMGDVMTGLVRRGVNVRAVTCADGVHADVGSPLRYARLIVSQYERESGVKTGRFAASGAAAVASASRVVVAGNGGACATASHAAIDWGKAGGRDVAALADATLLTAWANDYGWESAIARQVERVRWAKGDALVLFSGSGSSANVVAAAKRARELDPGPIVVAVTCRDNTPLAQAAHITVGLPYARPVGQWAYGPIEDAFSAFVHATARVVAGLAPWTDAEAAS